MWVGQGSWCGRGEVGWTGGGRWDWERWVGQGEVGGTGRGRWDRGRLVGQGEVGGTGGGGWDRGGGWEHPKVQTAWCFWAWL